MKQDVITLPIGDALKHVSPELLTQELLARINLTVAAAASIQIPAIGNLWQGGGTYAGVVRGDAGPDYHLIVHGDEIAESTWDNAMRWAKELCEQEQFDWSLPSRAEQAVMFGNVPELFQKGAYWSNTQYAGAAGYAWCQYFDDGLQYSNLKHSELRARAVRRLNLSNSPIQ